MNDFLLKDSLGYQNLHFGTTYLLFSKPTGVLLAYITLSMGAVRLGGDWQDFVSGGRRLSEYPKNFPNQFPALLIGRLATNKGEEGKGAASLLVEYALKIALEERGKIGCVCIAAHAYKEKKVTDWYLRKSFKFCSSAKKGSENVPMYLELG
ncbi:MAG: hypothetical protein V1822_00290 [Candidatus Micrarchaeota archaeon]